MRSGAVVPNGFTWVTCLPVNMRWWLFLQARGQKDETIVVAAVSNSKKGSEPQFIELQITDDTCQQQLEFKIKV